MFPVLHIGPLTIPTPGIIFILGLWLGLSLADKYSYKHNLEANLLYNLVLTVLIGGIITARLVYVAHNPASFLAEPINLLVPNLKMFDLAGGMAGGVLVLLIFTYRKKLNFGQIMDALTPLFAVMAIGISIANYTSGNSYGASTDLPWAVELWGARRHPVQIYEALSAGLILIILWPGRAWLGQLKSGGYFWAFLALSSLSMLITEAWHGDSILYLEKYRVLQLLALALLLLSLWVLRKSLSNFKTSIKPDDNQPM